MTTWAASTLDKLTVFYTDAEGEIAHTSFHVDSAASEGDIQTLVAALQNASDLSIQKYERTTTQNGSAFPAAGAYGAGKQWASAKAAMRMTFECGADSPITRGTLYGPKETVVTLDDIGNYILDLADGLVTTIETDAQAVVVSTTGAAVTLLKEGRMSVKHRRR